MDFSKLLGRVLRGTERNVALAGSVVAVAQKIFPPMEYYSTLKVTCYGGACLSWDCLSKQPLRAPWRDFLRWYHGRPQSNAYVMLTQTGSNMFQRKDIKFYSILNGERVATPSSDKETKP